MSDTQSTMREFRFLDDKRKTNGLAESEEARWIELGTALGIDLWAQDQASGYWTDDGFWYPYPAAVDPYAAWVAQQQWVEQQIAYWAEQGYSYDAQTGGYYPMQPVETYQTQWEQPIEQATVEAIPEVAPDDVYEIDDSEVIDRGPDERPIEASEAGPTGDLEATIESSATFVPSVDDIPSDLALPEPPTPEASATDAPDGGPTPPLTVAAHREEPAAFELVTVADAFVPLDTQLEPIAGDPMLEALAVDLLRPPPTAMPAVEPGLSDAAQEPAIDVIDIADAVVEAPSSAEASPIDIDWAEPAPTPHDAIPLIDTEITVETETGGAEWGAAVSEVSAPPEKSLEEAPRAPAEPALPTHGPRPSAPLAGPAPETLALAPPINAVPVPISGEHRVIVHTLEGQVKRGAISDAQLGVEPLKLSYPDGSTESLPPQRLKALFFMLPPGSKMTPPQGTAVLITLIDGRQVAGYTKQDPVSSSDAGFFVVPFDNRTNTERIFIFRHAVQRIDGQP